MKTTRPLEDWSEEQPHLQAILAEKLEQAFMNAETEHRPAIVIRRLSRPLDVDERATPGTMPATRPTVTTEPMQPIPEPVRDISGGLPVVNFYVPPFTWHMQILHAIKMRLETFKSISFNVRRIRAIHLCKRSYTVMKAMWTDYYYIDGCAIPVTDDHELSRKLRDDEVEIECW